jgi:hypothetical protein
LQTQLPTKAELEEAIRTGACLGRSEFQGADFAGAQVPNIDLRGSDLDGADFSGANASGGCFRQARMRDVNFSNAILRNVGMREVDLRGADMRGTDLRNAGMQDALLEGVRFEGAQLAGVMFGSAAISEGALAGALVGEFVVTGRRPMLSVGPLGPNRQFITAWLTNDGCKLDLGNELLDVTSFRTRLNSMAEQDRREYTAVLTLIETHAEIWS